MASKSVTSEGKALLKLGRQAVTAIREGSTDALDVIDAYADAFAKWEATWSVSSTGAKSIPASERELAQRLANQHAQVLRLTAEMQAQFTESLKGLRAKGKGLKRYIDQMPQKISTINKKG